MVNVASATGASSSALGQSLANAQADQLGRDEFLKLLVAQLKHQDPLKPQDNAEFVAELAQFSSLEQTMGINERLDQLQLQSQGMQNTQLVSFVGQEATVRGNLLTLDASGTGTPIAFSLGDDAEQTTVTIQDQSGRVIRTLDLGDRREGTVQIRWDGRSDAGLVQPAGTYAVVVRAKTADGKSVDVLQETRSTVQAVSFDKGYPVLHLDNGVAAPVSDLLRVDSNT